MPRIKPPKEPVVRYEEPAPEDDVEIMLADDDPSQPTEVDLEPREQETAPQTRSQVAPKGDDDSPLKAALEAQQRAEELARNAQRQADEANQRLRQRDEEIALARSEREDAQYNSMLTALAAEQSVLEKAEADYAGFSSVGDWGNAAKAQRAMALAASRIDRLEEGKAAFEANKKPEPERKPAAQAAPAPQAQDFEAKIAPLPEQAKVWLRKHPEFINDAAKNLKIQAAHGAIVELDGVPAFSEAYFDALDTRFGFKEKPTSENEPQPQRRSMPVSAPVSRNAPSSSGQPAKGNSIKLTPEERFIARNSFTATDMTNEQKEYLYAQNKRKLAQARANGSYRATTEENG